MNRWLIVGGAVLALGWPVRSIVGAEMLVRRAEPTLLALAPVDPRSLMQGDYMRLRYRLAQDLEPVARSGHWPRTGVLAITVDERGIATAGRLDTGAPLEPGERRLRYWLRQHEVRLGAESYFFQEGNAAAYGEARYGELRVDSVGNSVLVALRSEALDVLGPAGEHPLQ